MGARINLPAWIFEYVEAALDHLVFDGVFRPGFQLTLYEFAFGCIVGERFALNVLTVLAVDDFKVPDKVVISESLDYFGDGFGDVFAHALQIFYLVIR